MVCSYKMHFLKSLGLKTNDKVDLKYEDDKSIITKQKS